jgi:hypothetical protein
MLTEDKVIKALKAKGGRLSDAARGLRVTYCCIYQFIQAHPKCKEVHETIQESFLDLAESKLVTAIRKGAPWAICFYLKCQGKERGWVERQELTGQDGRPVTIRVVREGDE